MGKLRASPELWASLMIDAPWLKLERHASRDTRTPSTAPADRWCDVAGKIVPETMSRHCWFPACASLHRAEAAMRRAG